MATPGDVPNRTSKLVLSSKIEASWDPVSRQTKHVFSNMVDKSARDRCLSVETWQRRQRLGSGAFGLVWLEERVSSSRPRDNQPEVPQFRAVKEIRKGHDISASKLSSELEAIARFSQETFSHSFVRSFGWFESEASLFIAMEYLKHRDLQRYLIKPFPEPEARQIAIQVVQALDVMHKWGFVHRDLKPGNVLVVQKGPSWLVKICDFGISKRVEGSTALRTQKIGTEGFMAPEVMGIYCPEDLEISKTGPRATQKPLTYTATVDVWALGEMTHRMLTAKKTFEMAQQRFSYVVTGTPFPIRELEIVKASPDCVRFISEAMARSPRKRLTAAAAMKHAWLQNHKSISVITTRSSTDSISSAASWSEPVGQWTTDHQVADATAEQRSGVSSASKEDEEFVRIAPSLRQEGPQYLAMAFTPPPKQETEYPLPLPPDPFRYLYALSKPKSKDLHGANLICFDDGYNKNPPPFLFVDFNTDYFIPDSEDDMQLLHPLAESTARDLGLTAYWMGTSGMLKSSYCNNWQKFQISSRLDLARIASDILVITGKFSRRGTLPTVEDCVRSWGSQPGGFCLLLASLTRAKLFFHLVVGESVFTSPPPFSPIEVARMIWADNMSTRDLIQQAKWTRATEEHGRLICIMEVLQAMATFSTSSFEAFRTFPLSQPRATSTSRLWRGFMQLLMKNVLLERWLCIISDEPFPFLWPTDNGGSDISQILPLCRVALVGYDPDLTLDIRNIWGAEIQLDEGIIDDRKLGRVWGDKSRFLVVSGHRTLPELESIQGAQSPQMLMPTATPSIKIPQAQTWKDPWDVPADEPPVSWTLIDTQTKTATHCIAREVPNFLVVLGEEKRGCLRALVGNLEPATIRKQPQRNSPEANIDLPLQGLLRRGCVVQLLSSMVGLHELQRIEVALGKSESVPWGRIVPGYVDCAASVARVIRYQQIGK